MARRGVAAAVLLAAAALGAGCSAFTDGRPVSAPGGGPTEPTFPTSRPTATALPPSPTLSPSPPTAILPPPGEVLPADASGYVFIETKSGLTRCQISEKAVGCEAQFTNPPIKDGSPANGVNVTSDGDLQWIVGNLGNIPAVTLDYRIYTAAGWTIDATESGTKFTNDATGHGMYVRIEGAEAF